MQKDYVDQYPLTTFRIHQDVIADFRKYCEKIGYRKQYAISALFQYIYEKGNYWN